MLNKMKDVIEINIDWEKANDSDSFNSLVVKELKNRNNLTEAENELLYAQRRGHALFIAGTKKIHANFVINDTEFKYMGNAGGR